MSWARDVATQMVRVGEYVPGEMLTDAGRGQRGISEALVDLVGALPDEEGRGALCRVIASKLVQDVLTLTGKERLQANRMLMDYTDGLPTQREVAVDPNIATKRVIELTMRSADYEVVEE